MRNLFWNEVNKMSRRAIFTIVALMAFFLPTFAQDTLKAGVAFSNSEYDINLLESIQYSQGLVVTLNAKIVSEKEGKGFRLGGEFFYKRNSFTSPTDTYAFGPNVSYRVKFFEPYVAGRFGFNTTYNSDRAFTRIYAVGLDLNFGHIYLKPVEVTWERQEGFLTPATQSVNTGLGVRF